MIIVHLKLDILKYSFLASYSKSVKNVAEITL